MASQLEKFVRCALLLSSVATLGAQAGKPPERIDSDHLLQRTGSPSALVEAVEAGNIDRLRLLLGNGANPDEFEYDFKTPLLVAGHAGGSR